MISFKNIFRISEVFLLMLSIFLNNSCKKEKATPPTIRINEMVEISHTTAISYVEVINEGGAPIEYGGVCWNISHDPTIEDSKTADTIRLGIYCSIITHLTPNTKYYVRAYATNSAGTGYGNEISFTTLKVAIPMLTTNITNISYSTATGGGNISSDGGTTVIDYGLCWSTSSNPTTADSKTTYGIGGLGSFVSILTGLAASTTYYVRAYAINSEGTAYGNEISFTTCGSVTDIDLNIYCTIAIGTQIWMTENLKTTRYQDSSEIPNITDDIEWFSQTTGAYCWYNNDQTSYKDTYGALYNYHTIVDNRNICPTGWHVPTDAEWTTLITYLGDDAGIKLREIGTEHWKIPYLILHDGVIINSLHIGTNETGFSALPGGMRGNGNNNFESITIYGHWWSATENETNYSWSRNIYYDLTDVFRSTENKKSGLSIRCLKD